MKGDDEQGIGSGDTLDGRFILHSTVLNRAVPPVYIRRASKPSRAYQNARTPRAHLSCIYPISQSPPRQCSWIVSREHFFVAFVAVILVTLFSLPYQTPHNITLYGPIPNPPPR